MAGGLEPDDLECLYQPKPLNNSMIQCIYQQQKNHPNICARPVLFIFLLLYFEYHSPRLNILLLYLAVAFSMCLAIF